jgi:hypothetical protein
MARTAVATLASSASLDLAWSGPFPAPAVATSPLPYLVLFGGGFLLLSFVLILIGPRNDRRR